MGGLPHVVQHQQGAAAGQDRAKPVGAGFRGDQVAAGRAELFKQPAQQGEDGRIRAERDPGPAIGERVDDGGIVGQGLGERGLADAGQAAQRGQGVTVRPVGRSELRNQLGEEGVAADEWAGGGRPGDGPRGVIRRSATGRPVHP